MNHVGPELNADATFLIVGEAPGAEEDKAGRPFVGKSGKLLDKALTACGLARGQANITNVVSFRPKNNDIDTVGEDELAEGVSALKALIEDTKPKAILALGNTALWALTGKRQITERRGSLHWYEYGDDYLLNEWLEPISQKVTIPVIPALHPAAILRDPGDSGLLMRDIWKFKLAIQGELQPAPTRRLVIHPTPMDIEKLMYMMRESPMTAVDIETGDGILQCVGFAPTPTFAVCLHTGYGDLWSDWVSILLNEKCPKVFHNAPFDYPYLVERCGMKINGEIHDTLAMAQALHPELPRRLSTLTSLYTNEPYYKDMGQLWHKTKDYDAFWKYNCLDCATTREVADVLLRKLDEGGLRAVYEGTRKVLPYAMKMSMRGVRYDSEEAARRLVATDRTIKRWQTILDGRAGGPVNVYSPPQSQKFLYQTLKLPVQYEWEDGKRKITTKQTRLLSLYPKIYGRRVRQSLRAFLAVRHARKLRSTYFATPPSSDGRMRTSFNPAGTETGRWSAGCYLITTGCNLQTVPPAWKSCFIADDGCLLWNADYSQIEARIVAYLAEDERSIETFTRAGGDIHKENAAIIFKKTLDAVTSTERDLSKKTVHALNYGIGTTTLMETVNKGGLETGLWIDEPTATFIRNSYLSRFDRVVRWQDETWAEVKKTRRLTNFFGRRRIFLGSIDSADPSLSEHTKREAIAFVPQSTVPDMLNQAIVTLGEQPPCEGFEILLNIHDAIFGQAPAEMVEAWLPAIRNAMTIPLTIHGKTFTVPVDIKVGPRWSNMRKV